MESIISPRLPINRASRLSLRERFLPATLVLVLVTILGAFPVYAVVARRSYAGQGSIAMRKADGIRHHYAVSGPLAFIHVDLWDNRSGSSLHFASG